MEARYPYSQMPEIFVRDRGGAEVRDYLLDEFDSLVRRGEISGHSEICFPVLTGERFVPAAQLEFVRGLQNPGAIFFRRYFHLGRTPHLTLAVMVAIGLVWWLWQGGVGGSPESRLEQGAINRALLVELGQWWRLLSANWLHASGLHLGANLFFLLNLGGPAEAVFRRSDYLLIGICGGVLGMGLSAALTGQTSCGFSAVVFAFWGANLVFGMRHWDLLPGRYRRYFAGVLGPYAVVAIYAGVAMPEIDFWAHLGGLLAGALIASWAPPRLLCPDDSSAIYKLFAVVGLLLVLVFVPRLPIYARPRAGEITEMAFFPRYGLKLHAPTRFRRDQNHILSPNSEQRSFVNEAGVVVAFEAGRAARPIELESEARQFIDRELGVRLEELGAQGLRISEPELVSVAGHRAARIVVESVTASLATRVDYYIVTRGYFRYIISVGAPRWLFGVYQPVFAEILEAARWVDTKSLRDVRDRLVQSDDPRNNAAFGRSLVVAGQTEAGWKVLERGRRRWPKSGEVAATAARLLYESRADLQRACTLVSFAIEHLEWTPELLLLGADLHAECGSPQLSGHLLRAGSQRFPEHRELRRRMAEQVSGLR